MNNILQVLELRFSTYQDEIEKLEAKMWDIEIEQAENDYWTSKAEREYSKLEDKIYKLEIAQGKTQDKIDSIMEKLGITY